MLRPTLYKVPSAGSFRRARTKFSYSLSPSRLPFKNKSVIAFCVVMQYIILNHAVDNAEIVAENT